MINFLIFLQKILKIHKIKKPLLFFDILFGKVEEIRTCKYSYLRVHSRYGSLPTYINDKLSFQKPAFKNY